jgi:putative heme-binding domain-containing protein
MSKRPLRLRRILSLLLALMGAGLLLRLGPRDTAAQPATERGTIVVPPGFSVELVAAPPLVEHPMFACFDERGRLFVAESAGQNLKAKDLLEQLPNRIRLLEDTDGDGRFDKSTIFADKMTFPMGVLWHEGAVYSASPPSIWRLEDTDGDGVADKRQEFVTKFGFVGNAADIHGPFLSPDGRFYWTDGRHGHEILGPDGKVMKGKAARIFRCRPDGREIEVVCGGGMDDPVEIAFTPEGEALATVDIFIGRPKRIDAIIHCIEGGVFPYHEPVLGEFKRTGELLPMAVNLGWVAPSGLMRYRDAGFGTAYQGHLFSAQFNTHKIQHHDLKRAGATFTANNADFLVSKAPDFHPTDVLQDADGSLLVIDTGGWFRIGCPTSQIAKPEIKGAIYRVRRVAAPKLADPRGLKLDWAHLSARALGDLLDDARFAVRDRALAQFAHRGNEGMAILDNIVSTSAAVRARRNAVWAAMRMDTAAARALARRALHDKDASVRNVAAHDAVLHRDGEALAPLTEIVAKDPSAAVRREAATALGRLGRPSAVPALLDGLRAGADRFLEHASIYALIEIAERTATTEGLRDANPAVRRGALIALDQMRDGNLTPEQVVPLLDTEDAALRQTVWSLITSRPAWGKQVTGLVRQWLGPQEPSAGRREMLRVALLAFAKDVALQSIVAQALQEDTTPLSTRLLLLDAIAQMPLERLPSAWLEPLGRGLAARDDRVALQTIATLRARPTAALEEALQRVVNDEQRSAGVRIAALGAAAPGAPAIGAPLFKLLLANLQPEQPPLVRLAAATAMGNARLDPAQLESLTGALATAGALEIGQLLTAYERSQDVSLGRKLIAALGKSSALNGLAPTALRHVLQAYPPEIGEAAAPLLKRLEVDTEKQKARLAQLEPALAHGKARTGEKIFFGNKAACSTCHTVLSQGGHVGPDLSKIGSIRTSRDLLEAVVFPSASLVRGYEPYVITTQEGRVHTGIIGRETIDAIHLLAADRSETRIPRGAVDSIERGRVSIMPQGLDAQLTGQELADLIAYLQALR